MTQFTTCKITARNVSFHLFRDLVWKLLFLTIEFATLLQGCLSPPHPDASLNMFPPLHTKKNVPRPSPAVNAPTWCHSSTRGRSHFPSRSAGRLLGRPTRTGTSHSPRTIRLDEVLQGKKHAFVTSSFTSQHVWFSCPMSLVVCGSSFFFDDKKQYVHCVLCNKIHTKCSDKE